MKRRKFLKMLAGSSSLIALPAIAKVKEEDIVKLINTEIDKGNNIEYSNPFSFRTTTGNHLDNFAELYGLQRKPPNLLSDEETDDELRNRILLRIKIGSAASIIPRPSRRERLLARLKGNK